MCCVSKSLQAMGKTTWLLIANLLSIVLSIGLAWLLIASASPLASHCASTGPQPVLVA